MLVAAAVALLDLRKLMLLPLAVYLVYGPKDSLLAARKAKRDHVIADGRVGESPVEACGCVEMTGRVRS